MINPVKLLQLKESWDIFKQNHPKFPRFLSVVHKHAIQEGTIIEFKVLSPDGKEYCSNIRLKKSDIALMDNIRDIFTS